MTALVWQSGPDADTCTIELGGGAGELSIAMRIAIEDRWWRVDGRDPHAGAFAVTGPCTSRHDGRRAALDAIEATLVTGLRQVRDWRADI